MHSLKLAVLHCTKVSLYMAVVCRLFMLLVGDAVEAHNCVDPLMPNSFLSKNTTVNDKSTAGRFDPKVFVNCIQDVRS